MNSRNDDHSEAPTARIPANIGREDKILAQLTARQLIVLIATSAVVATVYTAGEPYLPGSLIAAVCIPIAAGGIALALGRRDGMSLDRYVLAALTYLWRPKTRVCAPEGVPAPPAWCRLRGSLPAPLRLPVRAIRTDGVMDLAEGGTAAIVAAATVSFTLRTSVEQSALIAAFARLLNSLDAPTQILVRAQHTDLTDLILSLREQAPGLPHSALEQAAHSYADHLAELVSSRDLLHRQVLLVVSTNAPTSADSPDGKLFHGATARRLRTRTRESSAKVTLRRAEHLQQALAGLGINAHRLDAEQTTTALADCLYPASAHPPPDPAQLTNPEPVTATTTPGETL